MCALILSGCASAPSWVHDTGRPDRVAQCSGLPVDLIAARAANSVGQPGYMTRFAMQNDEYYQELTRYRQQSVVGYQIVDVWHGQMDGQEKNCVLVEILR